MNLANRLSVVTQIAFAYRAGHIFTRTSTSFLPRTTVGSLVNPPLPRPCRWLPAVLVALVLIGFAPLEAVAQTPETQTVSPNSPLIPDVDVIAGPDFGVGYTFRLLFLTNSRRNATNGNISVYHSYVQSAAADGHAHIRTFFREFRALVSVANDIENNARDFTATNGIGIPIYWLRGTKVADDYDDFYDNSWDSRVATDEDGTMVSNPSLVWTGSLRNGKRGQFFDGFSIVDSTLGTPNPTVGRLDVATQEINARTQAAHTDLYPLYAMSPVIHIIAAPDSSLSALALSGNPPSFPAFSPAITDYRVSVPNDDISITLTPTPNNTDATVTIGAIYPDATTLPNAPINSGASVTIPLDEGLTVITIVVTATASDDVAYSTTYTVKVTRLPPPPPPPLERQLFVGSPLAPPGLTIGEQFRLLFVGGASNFTENDISHYNGIVTGSATGGHADIRAFADQFRALVSNATVDARDNTDTRDTGVPIYWLGGGNDKVANNYNDFYNGSWNSRTARNPLGNSVQVNGLTILTGSLANGVGQPNTRIGDDDGGVRIGRLDRGDGDEINSGMTPDNSARPLYGLSPVLTLLALGPQPPMVQYPIPDQSATARVPFSYTFPANSFYDINMDELTYSVAAPGWLTFDTAIRTVRGTPPSAAVVQSPISITVIASDGDPTTADVSDTFLLTVNPNNPAPPANVRAVAGDGRITVSWDQLVEDGGIPVTLFEAQVTRRFDNDTSTCMIADDPEATLCTITNLENGVEYSGIRVRAFTNPGTPLELESSTLRDDIVLTPLAATTLVPLADAFITTWRIDDINDRTITIPIHSGSTYAYTVDWGDDTTDPTTYDGPATHTYASVSNRNYVVTIRGLFPRINFNNSGDKDKIRTIRQWGTNVWSSMAGSFTGCTNLTIEATAGQPNLSAVTEMQSMFRDANSFNQPISDWDVGGVTNMQHMFRGATSFNQPLGGWNVINVTNMQSMFRGATSFNQSLGWDVSSVIHMSGMFQDATSFDQDLGAWDVGNVADMENMFNGGTLSTANYDSLLIGWSMVEDDEAELFEGVDFDAGFSQYCATLAREQLRDKNSWKITDGGRAMICPPEASAFVTTWAVQANQTIIIPTNSDFTYNYAVDWGDGDSDLNEDGNASHFYTAAGTYTIAITGTFPQFDFNSGGNRLAIRTIEQWGDIAWGSMQNSFISAAHLTIAANAGRPDLSAVTSMRSMFQGASNLNQPIGHWDVSNVTDMANMFQNAERVQSTDWRLGCQ